MRAVRNERGVALLIVLIIVALLTITVTEFTYSVQIDQHRTRNAMHAMQASLLARSGVNIMEGFLLQDGIEPSRQDVTWFAEEWWLQLNEFCAGLALDPSTLIRCRVRDESGKINVNKTYELPRQAQVQAVTQSAVVRDALRCIFERRGIDVGIVDQLVEYWQQEPPVNADGQPLPIPEFESLEGFGAHFGISTEDLIKLRPVVTAMPTRRQARGGPQRFNRVPTTNVNTASPEVLAALLNPEEKCAPNDAVTQILEKRGDIEPMEKAELDGIINSLPEDANNPGSRGAKRQLLGVDSNFYRLEASVLTNVDPENPSSGGIGQTLSELVERRPFVGRGGRNLGSALQGGGGSAPDQPLWTLRTLDWQKEGGARLFHEGSADEEQEPGSMGTEEGLEE